jgi:hypothetical protein
MGVTRTCVFSYGQLATDVIFPPFAGPENGLAACPIGDRIGDKKRDDANLPAFSAMMAEGVGFEPTVPLRARRFSRPVP